MKNKIALFLLIAVAVCQTGFAACPLMEKLKRGAGGVVTSPLELRNEYDHARGEYGVTQSVVSGLFVGAVMGVKRIINGAYDIVTFPVDFPKDSRLLLVDDYPTALDEYRALRK